MDVLVVVARLFRQWGVKVSLFTIISVYAQTSKIPQPRAPCNQNNMATTVNIFLSP